ECHAGVEAEAARGPGGEVELFDRPFLPRLWIAAYLRWCKGVEQRVVSRMHGHQLTLQVGRQFGDDDSGVLQDAFDLVAISVALGRLSEIEQRRLAGWNLDADKAL